MEVESAFGKSVNVHQISQLTKFVRLRRPTTTFFKIRVRDDYDDHEAYGDW